MPAYRFQVPAVIYFNIEAETPEAAAEQAELTRLSNMECGWDVDLAAHDEDENDHQRPSFAGRVYFIEDQPAPRRITTDDIVDTQE